MSPQYGTVGSQAGVLQERYVPGPGTDETVVWYVGSTTSQRWWLTSDERGSVTAVADVSGNVLATNTYDAYGVPSASNLGRFQYTGQIWTPELGLYHYKARDYSPTLGRFLQTDPIGYGDGMNVYAYAGNEPINAIDPTGEAGVGSTCDTNNNPSCGGSGATPTQVAGVTVTALPRGGDSGGPSQSGIGADALPQSKSPSPAAKPKPRRLKIKVGKCALAEDAGAGLAIGGGALFLFGDGLDITLIGVPVGVTANAVGGCPWRLAARLWELLWWVEISACVSLSALERRDEPKRVALNLGSENTMNVLLGGNNLLRLNLGAALCLLVITEFLAFLRWRSQSDSITADSKFHFLALCLLVILPFAMFIRIYASSRGAESREKTSFDSTNKTMSQFSGVVIASYVGMITIFSMLY